MGVVGITVVVTRLLALTCRRDHHCFAGRVQWLDDPNLRVEHPVGDQAVSLIARQQRIGTSEFMSVPRRELKARRIAELVDLGLELRAQVHEAASEGLTTAFFTPAECQRTRTMVT